MDPHTRARVKREIEYLANRLAREETERAHAKERENEYKFLQLSRNATLIKVRFPYAAKQLHAQKAQVHAQDAAARCLHVAMTTRVHSLAVCYGASHERWHG